MKTIATLAGVLLLLVAGGVGFPMPEDMTLVGAGALTRTGSVALWQVIGVGVVGVGIGDWILYLAGRRYGSTVLSHPFIARMVRRERLAPVAAFVQRRGAWAVFAARFVFGTRMATFLSAGTFGMPVPAFALAEGSGTTLFVVAMVTLGHVFAHEAERMLADVGHVEHWLVLGGLALVIAILVIRTLSGRRMVDPPERP